jgi:hypothetical protein
MRLRLYKRRAIVLPYGAIINFVIPDECDTLRIEKLTGDLTLNLIDPFGNDGDYLKLLLEADGVAPRTVTIAGPQGSPGTAVLAVGVAALYLVFHKGTGQYCSVVAP